MVPYALISTPEWPVFTSQQLIASKLSPSHTANHHIPPSTATIPTTPLGTATPFTPADVADPVFAVGLLAAVLTLLPTLDVLAVLLAGVDDEELAAPPVPVVSAAFPGATAAPSAVQAPVRVAMTPMLCRAAGVEPQLAACVIQRLLLSRSKTTARLLAPITTRGTGSSKVTHHKQTA